jgi:hypothetical protein
LGTITAFEFILKGIILTECLTRAARSWGIFDKLRQAVTMRCDFLRRLLACFECTSVWIGAGVVTYLSWFEWKPFTYLLIFCSLARWLNVVYEYLDASRAVKEGEI